MLLGVGCFQNQSIPPYDPLYSTNTGTTLCSPALRHPPLALGNVTQFCCPGSNQTVNIRLQKEETSLQLKNQTITQENSDGFQLR